jgi:hypothetical protein
MTPLCKFTGQYLIPKLIHRLLGYTHDTFKVERKKKPTEQQELMVHNFLILFRKNCGALADLDVYKYLYESIFKKPIDEEAVEDARKFANAAREKYITQQSTKYANETSERRETHMALGLREPGPWDDLENEIGE